MAQDHAGPPGAETPTVVLLSVSGAAGDHWAEFLPHMASISRCITYGRAGLGGSDPLPEAEREPGGLAGAVDELRAVLHAISAPPWVLVTASIGAFIADRFVTMYPQDVAGVVLTDPTSATPWPAEVEWEPTVVDDDGGWVWSWEACYAELGVPMLQPPPAVVVSSSEGRWVRQPPSREWWLPLTLEQVDRLWQGFQADWAARWNAVHLVAATAGHFVHRDQPELVAAATREVLAAVRERRRPAIDTGQASAAGGKLINEGMRS